MAAAKAHALTLQQLTCTLSSMIYGSNSFCMMILHGSSYFPPSKVCTHMVVVLQSSPVRGRSGSPHIRPKKPTRPPGGSGNAEDGRSSSPDIRSKQARGGSPVRGGSRAPVRARSPPRRPPEAPPPAELPAHKRHSRSPTRQRNNLQNRGRSSRPQSRARSPTRRQAFQSQPELPAHKRHSRSPQRMRAAAGASATAAGGARARSSSASRRKDGGVVSRGAGAIARNLAIKTNQDTSLDDEREPGSPTPVHVGWGSGLALAAGAALVGAAVIAVGIMSQRVQFDKLASDVGKKASEYGSAATEQAKGLGQGAYVFCLLSAASTCICFFVLSESAVLQSAGALLGSPYVLQHVLRCSVTLPDLFSRCFRELVRHLDMPSPPQDAHDACRHGQPQWQRQRQDPQATTETACCGRHPWHSEGGRAKGEDGHAAFGHTPEEGI